MEWNFKSKSIMNFHFKNYHVKRKSNNVIFNKVFIKNDNSEYEYQDYYKFKFQKYNKSYESISKLNKVCLLTGRARSIINPYLLKRQIFKLNYMSNNISFLVKKKICLKNQIDLICSNNEN